MHYDCRMARTDPQFNLRIPVDLKVKVEEAAKANGRSATSEILARLEASFRAGADDVISDPAFRQKLVDHIYPMVAEMHRQTLAVKKELALAGLSPSAIEAAIEDDSDPATSKRLPPIPQKGVREEPQAPARLDRWAKPKVRPEPPQYPKPKKGK